MVGRGRSLAATHNSIPARSRLAGVAILASFIAFVPAASAQNANTSENTAIALPSVDVVASKRRVAPVARQQVDQGTPAPSDTTDAATNQPVLSASENTFTGTEVNERPFSRPAEALEVVPGLIITQHSGDGKANQYFLRGFNLDHGTDLAISVDSMPVNMRTHGHGQGYADLNFLIPELIGLVSVKKGPYFADEGDFSSVGAVHVSLIDTVKKSVALATVGSFGYRRVFGVTSAKAGEGNLLVAGEVNTYNGPWDYPDKLRKLNAVVRYTEGTIDNGLSLTGMAYSNRWNSTDQVPLRAITSGLIGLYSALDPTDGGNSDRFSISGRWAQSDKDGSSKVNFYAIKSSLDLYNNFTFFLDDPVNGDQFHQHDDRVLAGLNASHTFNSVFAGLPMQTEIGFQSRYDDIKVSLSDAVQRQFLSGTRNDKVKEGSVGVFAQNTIHWTSWFRSYVGYRGDFYNANVQSFINPANSGNANASIGSPKFGLVFGPIAKTEFFFNAGEGFHSNDARGVTIKETPDGTSSVDSAPFLVKTRGAEIGIRTRAIPNLDSSVSLFVLDSASEILFVGDAGDTEPSRPSRRYGIEWSNHYKPYSWLSFDGDLAVTHARFRGDNSDQAAAYAELVGYPQSQIGNAPGSFIPGAPNMIASAGVRLGEATGWFAALRYRYFGPRPLTEDGAFVSPATGLLNGQVGYRFENGWRIQLDAYNLTDSRSDQITYAYGSMLKTDALFAQCASGSPPPAAVCQTGVMDRVLHPVEPLAVRLTLAGQF